MVFYKKGVCFQYMCTKHHLSFNLLCKIYILGLAYFITMIERTRSHQADVTTNYPHWSWQITNYRFTEFLPHRSYNVMYWNSKKVSVLTVSKAAVSASPPQNVRGEFHFHESNTKNWSEPASLTGFTAFSKLHFQQNGSKGPNNHHHSALTAMWCEQKSCKGQDIIGGGRDRKEETGRGG